MSLTFPASIMLVSKSFDLHSELAGISDGMAPLVPAECTDDVIAAMVKQSPDIVILDQDFLNGQPIDSLLSLKHHMVNHQAALILLTEPQFLAGCDPRLLDCAEWLSKPLLPQEVRLRIAAQLRLVELVKHSSRLEQVPGPASDPVLPGLLTPHRFVFPQLQPELLTRRPRILLVDDYPGNLESLQAGLSDEADLICCRLPAEGLKWARQQMFDLILLDVMMPEMNGYELCDAIKMSGMNSQTPFIFITALHEFREEFKGLNLGAVDFITKPFRLSVLKARIRNHLELSLNRQMLQLLSFADGLTGLPNRRHFEQVLQYEWMSYHRHGKPLTIALIDVDFFKRYNDTNGHIKGDECLQKVAHALRIACHRSTDFMGRYGGEEFIALFPDTDLQGGIGIANQMLESIRQLRIPCDSSAASGECVTISIGLASTDQWKVESVSELLDMADKQLYLAKDSGRNRLHHPQRQSSPTLV
jgi:diguanylate cyclase (GGDEF)-like protein